jgi:hypothetical protein
VAAHRHKASLEVRRELQIVVERKARTAVRFFEAHRRLLHSKEHGVFARTTLAHAKRRGARAARRIAVLRRTIHAREVRRLQAASPRVAICKVFQGRCREALDVAWCESRLQTDAQNGQYLGLFQMGAFARELFGHGPTAQEQAIAAHKYFMSSGRDWSPWSCKPYRA